MKITFIGLSCFLFENNQGDKLLIDPYHDSPQYYLGLNFPKTIQADVFLVSHPDEDHSFLSHSLISQKQSSQIKDSSDQITVFPGLNLKGTLVREFNGDLNIAFSYTIDGIRLLHLADNSHILSQVQLREIGKVDVLILPMPKGKYHSHLNVINQLNPKLIIPSHIIPPKSSAKTPSRQEIQQDLLARLLKPQINNPHANETTAAVLSDMFLQALALKDHFPHFRQINSSTIEISKNDLSSNQKVIVFRKCLGQ